MSSWGDVLGYLIVLAIATGAAYLSLTVWELPGFASVTAWLDGAAVQIDIFLIWGVAIIFAIGILYAVRSATSRPGREAIRVMWRERRPVDWTAIALWVVLSALFLASSVAAFVLLGVYWIKVIVSFAAGAALVRLTLRWLAARSTKTEV